MKLGLIARSDKTGLAYQTESYYKHLEPEKVLHIDLQPINGRQSDYSLYPNANIVQGFPSARVLERFLSGLDAVLTAETPYNYELYAIARRMGVRTFNVINPEFYDHIVNPHYQMPDVIILPSVWLIDEIKNHAESKGVKVVQLHHPVDRDVFKFRLRTTKTHFHLAGNPAAYDRNGTLTYLSAFVDGRVTIQGDSELQRMYRLAKFRSNIDDPRELYSADVMVLPRKYGGNCLPLNEALSCGLPVIMPDISPNNHLLPKEWLVSAYTREYFTPRTRIDIYEVDPNILRAKTFEILEDIETHSKTADKIAETISWGSLKEQWIKVLSQ